MSKTPQLHHFAGLLLYKLSSKLIAIVSANMYKCPEKAGPAARTCLSDIECEVFAKIQLALFH
jgi:hypothetical protein